MMGEIQLTNGKKAILEDSGKWVCEDKDSEDILNTFYPNNHNWILPPGAYTIIKACKGMNAKILKMPEISPPPPGHKS